MRSYGRRQQKPHKAPRQTATQQLDEAMQAMVDATETPRLRAAAPSRPSGSSWSLTWVQFNVYHILATRGQSLLAFAQEHDLPYPWLHRLVYRMPPTARTIDAALLVALSDAVQWPLEKLGTPFPWGKKR